MKGQAARGTSGPNRYRVPALERGLAVLEHLDQHPAGRSMADMARDLGMPKNAVFRITATLLHHGYLDRDERGKRLRLSHKTLALGYGAVGAGFSLVEESLEPMRALRGTTGETVCLSVLVEGEGFVVESVPGTRPFRCTADPGTRQPLHASASGKAILAHVPPREADVLLEGMRLARLTPNTITTKKRLREELQRVKGRGYAVDRCEHVDGAACVAAPVLDRRGYPVASLTVTAPAGRMRAGDLPALGRLVRHHADRISARLGALRKEVAG